MYVCMYVCMYVTIYTKQKTWKIYMSHYKKAQILVLHGWNIAEAILYIFFFIDR
jgi:hypothetical protein